MGHPHVHLPHAHIGHRAVFAALLAASALMVVLAFAERVAVDRGSGVPASEVRHVPAFAGVDLAGIGTVVVHAGRERAVTVSGDGGLLDHVTTHVVGERLVVGAHGTYRSDVPIRVDVGVPAVRVIGLSGAGEVRVDGVRTKALRVALGGAGIVTVRGRAARLDTFLTGGGTIDAAGVTARDVHAMLDGGGTMLVHARRLLDASVRGFGTVAYAGHPRTVSTTVTGAGVVTPR